MFGFARKKRVLKSFKKIANQIKHLQRNSINKKQVEVMIKKVLSGVQPIPNHELNSEQINNFERIMVKKAIKTRPRVIKQAIRELIERDLTTTNIFNIVVEEKKLVGKTQFYHYLSIVRAELRNPIQTEVQTKTEKTNY